MTRAEKIKLALKTLVFYRSALVGIILLLFIVGFAVYTVYNLPYDKAVMLWRAGEKTWLENPRFAYPEWYTLIINKNLPRTIIIDTNMETRDVKKNIVPITENMSYFRIEFKFDYQYDDFPSEINIFLNSTYRKYGPLVQFKWIKPDGEEIVLKSKIISQEDRYYISTDLDTQELISKIIKEHFGLNESLSVPVEEYLFTSLNQSLVEGDVKVLKGKYKLLMTGYLYEKGSDLDVKLIVYGKVYGIAGTDHLRRDLIIAIMWGAPIALAFGVTAALTIGIMQMIIAAISAWFSGTVDELIQRVTELNMILPFFPILLMISAFYKFNIWVLLVVIIALSVFGAGVKNYRALFLQLKEFPYVEAALSYGAGNLRIIFRYLIPKIFPLLIPGMIFSVADFVFLEAALAVLGLGDPDAPTWGKIINDALENGALYKGLYYWVLEPSFLLIITAISFALIGFTLEKIFNPKLREM